VGRRHLRRWRDRRRPVVPRGPLRRDDGQVQQDAEVMAETEADPVLPA
jgi:hypothetical protein